MRVIQVTFCGRFGNQLFQYAFARALAERYGAELQTPPWIGQSIFSIPSNPVTDNPDIVLPECELSQYDGSWSIVALVGFFQSSQFCIYTKKQIKDWFQIRPSLQIVSKYTHVYHLRRGDYMQAPHVWTIVSRQSYLSYMRKLGFDPNHFVEISEEEPHTEPSLSLAPDFLTDFQILSQAKVLFRSNSSFSWWAAALSDAQVFSPRIHQPGHSDCAFESGNHCSIVPGGPDICLST